VGVFGTLIGAAGGFLLIPVLFILLPEEPPEIITSITLTVAFFNALSGSIAYGRLKRIDYRSGILFSLAGVPGAVIGASITAFLSRGIFQTIFGVLLLIISGYLIVRPVVSNPSTCAPGHTVRQITNSQNNIFTYSYSRIKGLVIALGVGLTGGMFGIGGGIMHVPALTQLLCFPVHIATATSHFMVAITTFAAIMVHIVSGAFSEGIAKALVLSAGAVVGAQIGARLSHKVPGALIIRLLAGGLALVALRLLIAPF
jgi:uncharacterized membrane protein YfcA